MRESGVIDKTALVFGQMNEPPGARMRVAETGLTMAEYFRDVGIIRMCFCSSTIYSDLHRQVQRFHHFSDVCHQPLVISQHLQHEMGELQERIASTKEGSVTSVQAVYVPADDLTDPAPATTFAHLGCKYSSFKKDR